MATKHIHLVKKDINESIGQRKARYALTENSRLHSDEDRCVNTISYFLSHGIQQFRVIYPVGYDREGYGYDHPSDVITPDLSTEEVRTIVQRAKIHCGGIGTGLTVGNETFRFSLSPNGEFVCSQHLFNPWKEPNADQLNASETVWNLQDYFNSLEEVQ